MADIPKNTIRLLFWPSSWMMTLFFCCDLERPGTHPQSAPQEKRGIVRGSTLWLQAPMFPLTPTAASSTPSDSPAWKVYLKYMRNSPNPVPGLSLNHFEHFAIPSCQRAQPGSHPDKWCDNRRMCYQPRGLIPMFMWNVKVINFSARYLNALWLLSRPPLLKQPLKAVISEDCSS